MRCNYLDDYMYYIWIIMFLMQIPRKITHGLSFKVSMFIYKCYILIESQKKKKYKCNNIFTNFTNVLVLQIFWTFILQFSHYIPLLSVSCQMWVYSCDSVLFLSSKSDWTTSSRITDPPTLPQSLLVPILQLLIKGPVPLCGPQ